MSFTDATRQNILKYPSIEYASGQTKNTNLYNVGYLGHLIVRVKGTLNAKHATKTSFTKHALAPFNLISRLRATINGSVDIANASGFMLYTLNMLNTYNYNLDQIVAGSDVFQFGNVASAGGTDNVVEFTLVIPVKINDRDDAGLFLLQNRETVANISIDWAAPSVLAATADNDVTYAFTGSAYLTTEFFSVPAQATDQPPANFVHQIMEEQVNLVGTGENLYNHPRAGFYRRSIMLALINDSPAANTDIDKLELWLNQANNPYNILAEDQRALQRRRYGRDLPKGVYAWDWAYQGIPNLGNHRDYVNSRAYTEMQTKLYISSGASMGTNNNVLRVLREQLVPLQTR